MKNKATLDDGCNPKLVAGAIFDGNLEIPIIEKPSRFIIPSAIVPFSRRNLVSDYNAAVGFYEMDELFADVLIHPNNYIEDLSRYAAVISPDCSLYRDAPLSVQITNVYRNRAIGSYYQRKGLYVIGSLLDLYRQGKITKETALVSCVHYENMSKRLAL